MELETTIRYLTVRLQIPLFVDRGDWSKWQVGRKARVDWVREEPDGLVANSGCASQNAES